MTHVNLGDVEDLAPKFGLGEHQSARFATEAVDAERTGFSLIAMRPNARPPFAHRHREAEEVYVVLSGSGWIEADGEVVELVERDAIRVAPAVGRAFSAGPAGLEVLAFGARHPGDGELVERDVPDEAPLLPPPPFTAVLAALPVADPARAEAFHTALLGRGPDARPMPGLAEWHLAGAGRVQLVEDAERAGGGLLTLQTADLVATLAAARAGGLDLPEAEPGTVVDAFARLEDPDGNAITIVQA